MAKETPETLGE